MIKSVPVTPELEIIFQGKKNGLDIYKSAINVITIRPGSIHIHNGFANYLFQTTEWETVNMSSGNDSDGVAYTTSWYFVTLDKDGTIYTHAATGANSVRPSDTAYTWVDDDNTGFKHNKQGYYHNESERIIGAVYRSTDIDYIINNYDKADEVGENSNGSWEALSDGTMEQWGEITGIDCNSGALNTYWYNVPGGITVTFAKTFTSVKNLSCSWANGSSMILISARVISTTGGELAGMANTSQTGLTVGYHAIGRWKN